MCVALIKTARVVARPSPVIDNQIEKTHIGVGCMLSTVVRAYESRGLATLHVACVNGLPVDPNRWNSVQVRPNDFVGIYAAPGGQQTNDDKDSLTSAILSIGLMVAVFAIPGTGLLAVAGRSLLSVGGLWVIRQIAGQPDQNMLAPERIPSLNARNLLTPFAPMPRGYGEHIKWPRLIGEPYIENEGEDNWVRAIYLVDYGRQDVDYDTLKVNDIDAATMISRYGSEFEIVEGYSGEEPMHYSRAHQEGYAEKTRTVFPPLVVEAAADILIPDSTSWYPATPWSTPGETDEITCSFTWPEGLGTLGRGYTDPGDGGAPRTRSYGWKTAFAHVEVRVRAPGISDGWQTAFTHEWQGRTGRMSKRKARIKLTNEIAAVGGGVVDFATRWEVQTRMVFITDPDAISWEEGADHRSEMRWTGLRSLSWKDPIKIEQTDGIYVCTIGVRVPISHYGFLDRVNVVTRSYLSYYADGEWKPPALTASGDNVYDNPAWAYADVLRGAATKRPVPDDEIDGVALSVWGAKCLAEGFTFNGRFENAKTMYDAMSDIAAVARSSVWIDDGLISVLMDEELDTDAPDDIVTQRTISNYKGTKTHPEELHGLQVTYLSAANGWVSTSRYVFAEGYDESTAERLENINLFGVTNAEQADKLAWFYLNCLVLRTEEFTFDMDFAQLRLRRGSLIYLATYASLIGTMQGRVIAHTTSGTRIVSLTFDEAVNVTSPSTIYWFYARSATTGARIGPYQLRNPGVGSKTTFELQAIVYYATWTPTNDIVVVGEESAIMQPCVVTSLTPRSSLAASIACVPYSDDLFLPGPASYEPVVVNPGDLSPVPPVEPEIDMIDTDEDALRQNSDGTLDIGAIISLDYPQDYYLNEEDEDDPQNGTPIFHPPAARIEVQWRFHSDSAYEEQWHDSIVFPGQPSFVRIGDLTIGWMIDIRLRTVSADSVACEWVSSEDNGYVTGVEIEGTKNPPPDVPGAGYDGQRIFWTYVDDPPLDLAGFEIRLTMSSSIATIRNSNAWENSYPLAVLPKQALSYPLPNLMPGQYIAHIRARDTAGNTSANSYSVIFEIHSISGAYICEPFAEQVEIDDYTIECGPVHSDHNDWPTTPAPTLRADWVGGVKNELNGADVGTCAIYGGEKVGNNIEPYTIGLNYKRLIYGMGAFYWKAAGNENLPCAFWMFGAVLWARSWHVDLYPIPNGIDFGTMDEVYDLDAGWIPWASGREMYPITYQNLWSEWNDYAFLARLVVEPQPQALYGTPPRIRQLRIMGTRKVTQDITSDRTITGTQYLASPIGMTTVQSCVPVIKSRQYDDVMCRVLDLNPGSGNGPQVRSERADGSSAWGIYDFVMTGYRDPTIAL